MHYGCDFTVAENNTRFTKREVARADLGRDFLELTDHVSVKGAIDTINSRIKNCEVTPQDILRSELIYGKSLPCRPEDRRQQKWDALDEKDVDRQKGLNLDCGAKQNLQRGLWGLHVCVPRAVSFDCLLLNVT
jgi:hypothetical protein